MYQKSKSAGVQLPWLKAPSIRSQEHGTIPHVGVPEDDVARAEPWESAVEGLARSKQGLDQKKLLSY